MSIHTPGPWELQRTFVGWAAFAASPGFNPSRTIFECRSANRADAEAAANARLMAAAPDMLAAFHKIKSGPEANGISGIDSAEDHLAWVMQVVDAAIAKAEGK